MSSFSADTAWVTVDDVEEPLCMSVPIVLKLATIHYYAENTFSYISLPVDAFESQLIDYRLVYIADTDARDSVDPDASGMVRLVLTVAGQEFLKKVSLVNLVVELTDHQFSPDRARRWYPYAVPSDNVYRVAAAYMGGLAVSELPQFLSHEISTIREKAHELLTN